MGFGSGGGGREYGSEGVGATEKVEGRKEARVEGGGSDGRYQGIVGRRCW